MLISDTKNQKKISKDTKLHGVFLLDKPYGLSSNQALQKVKRLLNVKKAGHSGSLDPMATGMLPIFINQATKFSQWLLNSDKTYIATMKLGITTDTGDKEGAILSEKSVPELTNEIIEMHLEKFRGTLTQIPPMYSALKQNGKPLYQLARQGVEVERDAREIVVYQLTNQGYNKETNELTIEAKVSKGTYIRTLAEDIGQSIGCGAHLIALRRISCGGFTAKHKMHSLDELSCILDRPGAEKSATLIDIDALFDQWPVCHLSDQEIIELKRSGRWLGRNEKLDGWYVLKENQQFIGIAEFQDGQLQSRKLLIE